MMMEFVGFRSRAEDLEIRMAALEFSEIMIAAAFYDSQAHRRCKLSWKLGCCDDAVAS